MSKTWSHPLPRRSPGSFHASRALRRTGPYQSKEDRDDDYKHGLDRYEELEKSQAYSAVNYEGYTRQEHAKVAMPSPKVEGTPSDRRKALYQKFYKHLQEAKTPDCVVLSTTNENQEYTISLCQALQKRGLHVEMLYLHAESGLTRALQDIRADGSSICILVEQRNIALCSCTVIIFAQSLKIHRNMPQDQALDFVVAEYNRGLSEERPSKDPSELAAETSQMLDDYLNRDKHMHHYVPSDVRHLLMFLAEGVHVDKGELDMLSEYVLSRQEQADKSMDGITSLQSAGLGKPPPLLPTPILSQPPLGYSSQSLPGTPPPLMSKCPFGPMSTRMPGPRAPLLNTPQFPRGPPRRLGPRPALLPWPGGPLLPRHRLPPHN
ncbi:unnamed protein product [Knipowitschia caucasica]|uniref:Nuclear receptor coactivator 5-like n=1 Tax=Knipowitschia caucasica TaxID=637954 RepID=A0AAV2L6M1_KNICA